MCCTVHRQTPPSAGTSDKSQAQERRSCAADDRRHCCILHPASAASCSSAQGVLRERAVASQVMPGCARALGRSRHSTRVLAAADIRQDQRLLPPFRQLPSSAKCLAEIQARHEAAVAGRLNVARGFYDSLDSAVCHASNPSNLQCDRHRVVAVLTHIGPIHLATSSILPFEVSTPRRRWQTASGTTEAFFSPAFPGTRMVELTGDNMIINSILFFILSNNRACFGQPSRLGVRRLG